MKTQNIRLLILWHIFLAVLVASCFLVYHNHVVSGDFPSYHVSVSMDEGIPVPQLIDVIKNVEESQSGCRILSVEKKWTYVEVTTAWITNSYRRVYIWFTESDQKWKQTHSNSDNPIEGIPCSEMIEVLQLTSKESTYEIDKRILSISIQNEEVRITTGVTNHSLGGSGNTLTFEKVEGKWIRKRIGNWIS